MRPTLLDGLPEALRADPAVGDLLKAFEKILLGRPDGNAVAGLGLEQLLDDLPRYLTPGHGVHDGAPAEFLPWLSQWMALSLRTDIFQPGTTLTAGQVSSLNNWLGRPGLRAGAPLTGDQAEDLNHWLAGFRFVGGRKFTQDQADELNRWVGALVFWPGAELLDGQAEVVNRWIDGAGVVPGQPLGSEQAQALGASAAARLFAAGTALTDRQADDFNLWLARGVMRSGAVLSPAQAALLNGRLARGVLSLEQPLTPHQAAVLNARKRRDFIANMGDLYRYRGTERSLRKLLAIFTGIDDVAIDDQVDGEPYYFVVRLNLEALKSGASQLAYDRALELANSVIRLEKPSHTRYLLVPEIVTMRIGPGRDETGQPYFIKIGDNARLGIVPRAGTPAVP